MPTSVVGLASVLPIFAMVAWVLWAGGAFRRRASLRVTDLPSLQLAGAQMRWLRWTAQMRPRLGTALEITLPSGKRLVATCSAHFALDRDYQGELDAPMLAPDETENVEIPAKACVDANHGQEGYRVAGSGRVMPPCAGEGPRTELPLVSTGYHAVDVRNLCMSVEGSVVTVTDRTGTQTLAPGQASALRWTGSGRSAPLYPLPAIELELSSGPFVLGTHEALTLADAVDRQAPGPHVWVPAVHLEIVARALGIEVTRVPASAVVGSLATARKPIIVAYALLGLGVGLGMVLAARSRGTAPHSCADQAPPAVMLYPRLSCSEARDETERVRLGQASPRAIVLRPSTLTIDAKDVTGPATMTCDGIVFPIVDARQADPTGPIVMVRGPHSVLVTELPSGQLRVAQYDLCGNVVGKERKK